jgi:hypothetical protein
VVEANIQPNGRKPFSNALHKASKSVVGHYRQQEKISSEPWRKAGMRSIARLTDCAVARLGRKICGLML